MYIVRPMTDADIEGACCLWRASRGVTLQEWETPELISRVIKNFEDLNVVAVEDGKVIGAVLGGYFGLRGLIQHLAVSENHQRRGVATEMLNCCFQAYKRRNVRRVLLGTNNLDAISFYKSIGFVEDESVKLMWTDV